MINVCVPAFPSLITCLGQTVNLYSKENAENLLKKKKTGYNRMFGGDAEGEAMLERIEKTQ